jgi:hypothetical protein
VADRSSPSFGIVHVDVSSIVQVDAISPAHLRDVLLRAGTPVHVVSERLGHAKVSMTLEV